MIQGKRIDPETIKKIQHLLERGLSQRNIAERIGVARGTVKAVQQGSTANQRDERIAARYLEETGIVGNFIHPVVCALYRCKSCNNNVTLKPCLICSVRASVEHKRKRRREKKKEREHHVEDISNHTTNYQHSRV